MENVKDLFIIGGGINGVGIAADAAGRGLSVTLCEKNDLASGTSSASTKLIHGGLRYLEFFDFSLVREALREREILMRKAPYLIFPLKFILPHEKHLRPAWMIRLGLFLYDHLAKRHRILGSKTLTLQNQILKNKFSKAFSYYDCFTDDARLVITNAIAAREKGAEILTYSEFIKATFEKDMWRIIIKDFSSDEQIYYAKVLINAAGPYVEQVNQHIAHSPEFHTVLDKGSHIVIPKLYSEKMAFILQNEDQRIVFTIPYQEDFTLIGTTDKRVKHPEKTHISSDEIQYLCDTINHYFQKSISPEDIIWSYTGVRCLQQEKTKAAKITRGYQLLLTQNNSAPLLTVIGGKLTTFRKLAEDALAKLKIFFPHMGSPWTEEASLPGGNMKNFNEFLNNFKNEFSWLPANLALRYAKNYGTRAKILLQGARSIHDLGENFGADLFAKEIDYLIQDEWAKTAEDILWRRTKLGLYKENIHLEKLSQHLRFVMPATLPS